MFLVYVHEGNSNVSFLLISKRVGQKKGLKSAKFTIFGQKYPNSPTLSVWYVPQKIFRA